MNPADYLDWLFHLPINEGDDVVVVLYDNDTHVSKDNCIQINRQSVTNHLYVPNFCKGELGTISEKEKPNMLKRLNQEVPDWLAKLKIFMILKEG
jgi:hypothetical protein